MSVTVTALAPSLNVAADGLNVTIEAVSPTITVVASTNEVEVLPSTNSVAEVLGLSTASILDDPYLGVKRLREIGPSVATYTYNADGTVATKAIAGAETLTYNYSGGDLVSVTDGTHTTALAYDGDGDLTTVTRS